MHPHFKVLSSLFQPQPCGSAADPLQIDQAWAKKSSSPGELSAKRLEPQNVCGLSGRFTFHHDLMRRMFHVLGVFE